MGSNRRREPVFRFRQFSVRNELSAMKVGTDGVLLGAWADVAEASAVLDVGTGSGVISLMVAQRGKAMITAIEIDSDAALEAEANVVASPWRERIMVVNDDFVKWAAVTDKQYDHIVSNPPFFANGIVAPDSSRALARHGNGLDYYSLISSASRLLVANGKLSMISPVDRQDDILFSVEMARMSVSRITEVCSVDGQRPVRLLWELSPMPVTTVVDRWSIRDKAGNYSSQYIELTRDFYLNM